MVNEKIYRLVKCPTCEKLTPWNQEQNFRPFCSERCKMIDLGEWFSEQKAISGDDLTHVPDDEA